MLRNVKRVKLEKWLMEAATNVASFSVSLFFFSVFYKRGWGNDETPERESSEGAVHTLRGEDRAGVIRCGGDGDLESRRAAHVRSKEGVVG